ncbi:Bloom syndrome protein -like protein [Caligus rogercresseyi]|uniref:Bloom syndrome protein -like protein n=1 Tax=Caligus rogercresseyi TaxID=217165 RepID=A0A7T8GN74_CALRO|nr:Bloom syndrome protein -like protein [Caligus rogercresseyi]
MSPLPRGRKESLLSVTNRGVTVVLSRLASLIYDKFTKLDGLGIPADHLMGTTMTGSGK